MVVLLLDKFTKTWNCILSLMTQKQTKKKNNAQTLCVIWRTKWWIEHTDVLMD